MILLIDGANVIKGAGGNVGETVGKEHDDLMIVGPGHEGKSGGAW